MQLPEDLLTPQNCALVLIDHQAGLAFGVQSIDRQALLNNTVALVKTALAFDIPIITSTSASKVYSGPLLPALRELLAEHPIHERKNMNVWEDEAVQGAILKSGRKNLIFSGMLTEACISLPVICAQQQGFRTYVVADACAGLSNTGHEMALRRMEQAGAQMTTWMQILLELQRDWTRRDTYESVRSIVESNGGGYGIGLRYARDMLPPP